MTDGNVGRRRFLRAIGAAGVVAVAGCTGSESDDTTTRTRTEATSTATTTEETTHSPTETTTTDQQTVEDVRQRRENLTEQEKKNRYQSGINGLHGGDHNLETDLSQIDSRREQLIAITEEVGDQYAHWAEATQAVGKAVHNELDWMNWENRNLVNIVTRFNSSPFQEVTANYSTEDGGRNLDGMIARDDASGEQTYIENIPDSEYMDGDEGNFLTTDIENLRMLKESGEMTSDGWEMTQLTMQSIIPGAYGPDVNDGPVRNRNIIFDGDGLNYIGEHYNESPEAVNEVSEESMEIEMASVPVRTEGNYIGVTAGQDGLEIDAVYSQAKGEEKMRDPVEL